MLLHPLFGAPPLALIKTVMRHGGVRAARVPLLAAMVIVSWLRLPGIGLEAWRIRRRRKKLGQEDDASALAPVFIVGHWRSGTTLLHNLLSSDPGFVSPTLFEALSPAEFLSGLFRPAIRWFLRISLPRQRPMDTIPVCLDMPMEEDLALAALGAPSVFNCFYFPKYLPAVFEQNILAADKPWEEERRHCLLWFCRKIAAVHPGRRLLLKSPANSTRILQLKKLFPGARFIHIHRDPEAVFTSTCRLYEALLPIWALQTYNAGDIGDHVASSYPAVMQRLLDECGRLPAGEVVTTSYEDLVDAPLRVVKDIYDTLGIEMSGAARAAHARYLAAHPIVRRPRSGRAEGRGAGLPEARRPDWLEVSRRLGYC